MQNKMKQFCKRVIAAACAVSMVLGGLLSDIGTVTTKADEKPTLWLVGDSTVCEFNDTYYYPRYGYGTQIANYLDGTYTVQNLAVSGTSSKSFTTQANYTTLTSGIKSGDVLVIGFGHNDEKAEEARYTNPNGDYQTEGSFAKSLYDNYVKVAKDAGAEVILCTPIVRRYKLDTLPDANCHITSDDKDNPDTYPGGDYPQAIRELGTAVSVPVVDLTALTKELYESIGASETLKLHCWTGSDSTSVDNTHLNIYGAKKVAWMFANAVKTANATSLASHITNLTTEPTEADLVVNPNWVEPPAYDGTLAESSLFKDYVIGEGDSAVSFKGTAFGALGGAPTTTNHILETDSDGNMHVQVKSDKGKITSSADGIVMYYYKVPVTSSFSLSAKATVNSIDNNAQAAFGLMARDDMYIDTRNDSLASSYVVAGTLGTGCNCFYRKNGSLGGKAALTTETLAEGKSYNLSIVSNPDGYACTFGNETTQTAGYDFTLTSVDSNYVYIGMFAARNADITYSDIRLVVDGEVICDTTSAETTYNVTVTSEGNGTASASKSSAAAGKEITLTAKPNVGYVFKEWQVVSGDVTINDDKFTMLEGDVAIKAVFEAMRTTWNFKSDSDLNGENAVTIQNKKGTVAQLQVDATSGKWDSTSASASGVAVSAGTKITVPINGKSNVAVVAGTATYTVDGTAATAASDSFVCEATYDDIAVIEITADTTLDSITVTEYKAEGTRIDVWDFGGKTESDLTTYTNNITPNMLLKASDKGLFAAGSQITFGDLTMAYGSGDRIYSNIAQLASINYGSYDQAQKEYEDGYVSAGAWYGGGAGTSSARYVQIDDVKAGDKIVAYIGIHDKEDSQFVFEGLGDASGQKETVDAAYRTFQKYEFVAAKDGSYKIYESGTGKPMYHRIVRVPGVAVSGTIDLGSSEISNYTVKFVNKTTREETVATLDGTNFTATLAAGYEYTAVLSGATGFGFTNTSKKITTTDADALTGISNVTLKVEPKSTYTYSGTITGFASGYDVSGLTITMVPTDSNLEEVALNIDKSTLTFSGSLESNAEYTIRLGGVNDYEVTSNLTINQSTDYQADITVGLKKVDEGETNTEGLKVVLADKNADYTYTGIARTPAITVTFNGEPLTAGTDYTVKYTNNVKASHDANGNLLSTTGKKLPTVTVTGKGNLTGSAYATFDIKQKNIADDDIEAGSVVVVKGTKGSKIAPVLVYGSLKLTNKDYEIVADDKTKSFDVVGTETGTLTIKGKGNFTGSREIKVTVVESKKDLKKIKVDVPKKTYTFAPGTTQKLEFTVKSADSTDNTDLQVDKDYTVVTSGKLTEAGTVKVTVIGQGEYTGTVTKTFKINPLKAAAADFKVELSKDSYEFVSTGVTFDEDDLTVTYHKGLEDETKLVQGVDYKITYSNNKKVSTEKSLAKYTITFLGNYKGSKAVSGTFKITPASLSGARVISSDKVYTGKSGTYASKPLFVLLDGVVLKSSDYKVSYYLDENMKQEIKGKANNVSLSDYDDSVTVYVKVTGKGNYEGSEAKGEYQVWSKDMCFVNMAKAKLSVGTWQYSDAEEDDEPEREFTTKTKWDYTGEEVEPDVKVVCNTICGNYELYPEDYEVVYVNNVKKGKATAIVIGNGEDGCIGCKAVTFSIVAQKVNTGLLSGLFK